MASTVQICNMAIALVAGNRITALTDETKEATQCNLWFDPLRKAVLEDADWAFAIKRFSSSTPESSSPDWGYTKKYTLNPEVVRVIHCTDDADNINGEKEDNFDWQREENTIVCDADAIYYKAVMNITDASKFSPGFVQALAARIAVELAIPIAGSRSLMEDMWQLYDRKMDMAVGNDGRQGRSLKFKSSQYRSIRHK